MSMEEELQRLQQELERDGFVKFRGAGPLYHPEVGPEIDATVRKPTRPTKVTSRPKTPRAECVVATSKPRIIEDVPWTKPVRIVQPEAKRATSPRPVSPVPEPATTAPEPAPERQQRQQQQAPAGSPFRTAQSPTYPRASPGSASTSAESNTPCA